MNGALRHISNASWQFLLLGLLGIPGVLFIPLLLRWVPVEVMASILVMQVYVYYLILVAQYGFFLSGPAHLARSTSLTARYSWLIRSLKCKSVILAGPIFLLFLLLIMWQWESESWYLLCFAALLLAYAFNSNWFLQAFGGYASGVLYTVLGVFASSLMAVAIWLYKDSWSVMAIACGAVGVLIFPQTCLGFGSALHGLRMLRADRLSLRSNPGELMHDLREGLPLVLSQLLALASTTLGTLVVARLSDPDTTAAYAATEKIFNLGATVLMGLYTAIYPRLAEAYVADPERYWKFLVRLLCVFGLAGITVLFGLYFSWGVVSELYLGKSLAVLMQTIWLPFGIWLSLCIVQPILSGYLVIVNKNKAVLWVNGLVLAVTLLIGCLLATINPISWVWGMVSGQLLVIFLLGWFYWKRASTESARLM